MLRKGIPRAERARSLVNTLQSLRPESLLDMPLSPAHRNASPASVPSDAGYDGDSSGDEDVEPDELSERIARFSIVSPSGSDGESNLGDTRPMATVNFYVVG
jgi:hypothetical protein